MGRDRSDRANIRSAVAHVKAASVWPSPLTGENRNVSLRGQPIEQTAVLPDGREVVIWIGVPNDSYIRHREIETVAVELRNGDHVLATVNSVLEPRQTVEAWALARELATGLESGQLPPTAGGIEPLTDRVPTPGV
jgi:hypothetical protein